MALVRGKLAALALFGVFAAVAIVCTSVYSGSCKSTNCEHGCVEHDQFCGLAGGGGTWWGGEIARETCTESPDGGKPIEYDLISYSNFSYCSEDCLSDADCTGTVFGPTMGSGDKNVKTLCSES